MGMVTVRQKFLSGVTMLVLVAALSANSAHPPQQAVAPASASEIVLTLDPGRSMLHWTLGTTLHTVHGTFALKRGIVRLDPVTNNANGEIVADATSGQSGNGSRDKRMHNEILESPRHTEVVFRPDGVIGNIPAKGSSTVRIHGTFLLHGSNHELTVPVQVELSNDQWKGTAKFAIPYVQWGLKNPSNFLLKVDSAVDIDVEMTGSLRNSPQP
jgi:polyisoprenoid-binding protein YceI